MPEGYDLEMGTDQASQLMALREFVGVEPTPKRYFRLRVRHEPPMLDPLPKSRHYVRDLDELAMAWFLKHPIPYTLGRDKRGPYIEF